MALSANHVRRVCDPLLNPDPHLTGAYIVQGILLKAPETEVQDH